MSEKNDDTKQIIIQKLYIKDSSFESPNTPEVFKGAEWKPKTDLNLSSSHVLLRMIPMRLLLQLLLKQKTMTKQYLSQK